MAKQRKKNNTKIANSKGLTNVRTKASKINSSTDYETCKEQLSPFGGLLGLIKFLDRIHSIRQHDVRMLKTL